MGHGVWSWAELRGTLSQAEVRHSVAAGRLVRVRRGWYATPLANPDVLAAVALGGRLGCLSGCRAHGLWVPPGPGLHVAFNRALPAGLPDGVSGHASREIGHQPALLPLESCLADVLRHHALEVALVVLDSALNSRAMTIGEVADLVLRSPPRTHRLLRYVDAGAGSGSETRVRYYFQRRRVPVQTQAWVPGVGHVDLRVGKSLMIECDSRAHHTGEANYQRDRERDLVLTADGHRVLRLSYEQVWYQWDATRLVLRRLIRSRLHRILPLSARRS